MRVGPISKFCLALTLVVAIAPLPARSDVGSAPTFPARLDGRSPVFSGPAVIVLWATWCASCIAELKRIPRLEQAARPLPIVTLAIDPPERARMALERAGVDIGNAFADPGDPAAVLAKWGGTTLPLAVAVDAQGRICGRKHGLLGTDEIKKWAKSCSN